MRQIASDIVTSPWALTLGVMLVAVAIGRLLVRLLRPVLASMAGRTASTWDDLAVQRLASPVSLLLALLGFRITLPWLELESRVLSVVEQATGIAITATLLWGVFRAIDLVRALLEQRSWAIDRPTSRSAIAIGARFAKVAVVLFGAIIVLAQLGVSVASLIAGLGIGGIALALAAQKTIENLFGTFSIGVDRPMREGDFVKVYDLVGTVEQIGLRSTRIRTLDRTLVTIPNGELSNQRIESYTVRDRIRLATIIGLVYETTAAQLRGVLEDLERILREHPKIWPDTVVVRFQKLGESSLDVEVMAWFQTTDWDEFLLIRQEVLLAFMDAIERRGTSIAFPTRTVHVAQPAATPARSEP